MPVNHFPKIVFLIIAVLLVAGCGGDFEWFPENKQATVTTTTSSNSTTSSASTASTFETYNFTATVDQITGTPPFQVAIGDKLTGKFVYQLNAKDWNADNVNQGYFHDMNSPAGIEITINSFSVSSTPDTYTITIVNDDSSVAPVRDIFEVFGNSCLVSDVQIIYTMRDFGASVFTTSTCNSLPKSLNLDSFDNNYMFLNSNATSNWSIRLLPDSLTKV